MRTKFVAVRAEEPGGAHDDAVGAALGDQPFTEQFGAPVGASRPGRIVLAVGAIERAVEHVIGGQVQQRRADSVGGFRHVAGPLAVDGDGEALLRLGLVDGGVGSGVDHHVRPRGLEASENSRAILKQEYAAAKQDDLELAPRLLDQRGRHLTHRPSDGDPHHVNKSPASVSRGGGGFVAGYVHAPRANRTTRLVSATGDQFFSFRRAGFRFHVLLSCFTISAPPHCRLRSTVCPARQSGLRPSGIRRRARSPISRQKSTLGSKRSGSRGGG